MMRLRIGKFWGRGSVPGGYSETKEVLGAEPLLEAPVLARIVHVEAAAEHRDRAARPLERRLVSRGVHAAREPRDDRDARRRELAREPPGDVAAVARGVPRPDDRHRRKAQPLDPPEREEEKRRIGDLRERAADTRRRRRSRSRCRRARSRRPSAEPRDRRARAGRPAPDPESRNPRRSRPHSRTGAASRPPRARRTGQSRCGVIARPRAQESAAHRETKPELTRFNVLLMERGSTIPAISRSTGNL